MVAEGRFADSQRKTVPVRAMRTHVSARIKAHARRSADRGLHVCSRKPHPTRSQRVYVWGLQIRVARATEIVKPKLITHDEQHVAVGHGRSLLFGLACTCTHRAEPHLSMTGSTAYVSLRSVSISTRCLQLN